VPSIGPSDFFIQEVVTIFSRFQPFFVSIYLIVKVGKNPSKTSLTLLILSFFLGVRLMDYSFKRMEVRFSLVGERGFFDNSFPDDAA
jgi:hypothetical protein